MTNRPITEQDEFLLSRLVDDDLPAEQAEALRARIEREPELSRVFRRLQRLDAALSARRHDQPVIDWDHFHRQVMDRVERETPAAGPVLFKLNRYLKWAMPLAAAAAIILVVWMQMRRPDQNAMPRDHFAQRPTPPAVPGGRPDSELPVVQDDRLLVTYHRVATPPAEAALTVAYARSEALQKEFEEIDEQNRRREPSGAVVVAHESPEPAIPRSVLTAVIASQF